MTTADGLVAALARAQAQFKPVVKGHTNPHYKSKYADLSDLLAAVTPALLAEGIVLVQPIENGELVTRLMYGTESIESRVPLDFSVQPQSLGSQLTYMRRYSVASLLAVASEDDDDGNAASTARPRQQTRSEPAAPPDEHLVEFNRLCAALGLDKAKDKAGFIATVTGTDAKWAQCSEETHVYIVGQLTAIASGELTLGFDNAGRPMAYPTGEEPFELDTPADAPAEPVAAAVEALAEARQATRGTK